MAFLEIYKNDVLAERREVSESKAQAGIRVRVPGRNPVKVDLGQTVRAGEYVLKLLAAPDAPSGEVAGRKGVGKDAPVPLLDGFELTDRLGQGGMGVVWRAIQLGTKRPVAVKFLDTRGFTSEKSQQRFQREVELAARLEHPNIARIYESGLHRGGYYYAMELIPGAPLDRYARDRKLSPMQIVKLFRDVCQAVAYAHGKQVIHRDLKPANILVTRDGRPHILDFGLAKALVEEEGQVTISWAGEVSGTPAYMSPEQAAGRHDQVDTRSDVYSLGVIFYRMLLNQPPHDLTGTRYDVIRRIVEDDVRIPPGLAEGLPAGVRGILLKALARQPEDRYLDAGKLAQALDICLREEAEAIRPKPAAGGLRAWIWIWRIAALAMVAGLALSLQMYRRTGEKPGALVSTQLGGGQEMVKPDPGAERAQAQAARSQQINILLATAKANDSKEKGQTALAVLEELLKLDPRNNEALALQKKIAGYYPPELPAAPFSAPAAKAAQAKWAASLGAKTEITNTIGMKLALIPAGTFTMGTPDTETGRNADEGPQHQVTLTKPYYLALTMVTQAQWKAVMGATNNPSSFKGDDLPVEMVSWSDAADYCLKLSQQEGKKYRLPTEAEWEYACRAGTTGQFYTGEGEDALQQAGWYLNNSGSQTHPVGQKAANAFGLYDMHGNVWEWCADWYAPYAAMDQTDPTGPANGTVRVLRGGSWDYVPQYCRSGYRYKLDPGYRDYYSGFRVVLDSN